MMNRSNPAGIALSRDEVHELCRTMRKAGQVRFLCANGIRHYVDAHGWPVVLRAHVEGTKDAAQSLRWKSNKAA